MAIVLFSVLSQVRIFADVFGKLTLTIKKQFSKYNFSAWIKFTVWFLLSINSRLWDISLQLNFKDICEIKLGRMCSCRPSHKDCFDSVLLLSLGWQHKDKYHCKHNKHHSFRINVNILGVFIAFSELFRESWLGSFSRYQEHYANMPKYIS